MTRRRRPSIDNDDDVGHDQQVGVVVAAATPTPLGPGQPSPRPPPPPPPGRLCKWLVDDPYQPLVSARGTKATAAAAEKSQWPPLVGRRLFGVR